MNIHSSGGVARSAGVGGFNPANPPQPPPAATPPERGIVTLFSSVARDPERIMDNFYEDSSN